MFLNESEFRRVSESRLQIVCSGSSGDAAPITAGEALQLGNQLLEELGIATPERVVLVLLPHSWAAGWKTGLCRGLPVRTTRLMCGR